MPAWNDSLNMVPTFRLVVGRPGRSHAFLVAKRLGLDEDVLDRAKELIPEDVIRLEDIIADMEAQSQRAREEAERAAAERAVYQELRSEYEHKLSSLEAQRKKVLRDARREAQSIIARAKVEFEKALQEIKDSRRQTSGDFHDTASKIRSRLARIQADSDRSRGRIARRRTSVHREPEAGMQVMVSGFLNLGLY